MVMLWLLLWLLHQSGERLCYGCGASQEKINMSAVPMPPGISSQPLSLCLAYPGSNKQCGQCEQQYNWCHGQDQQGNWHSKQDTQQFEEPGSPLDEESQWPPI